MKTALPATGAPKNKHAAALGKLKKGKKEHKSAAKAAANAKSLPLATLVLKGKTEEADQYRREHYPELTRRRELWGMIGASVRTALGEARVDPRKRPH